MDFLFVNTQELSALTGLPYIQQVTYLIGIRPHMDRKSFVVGIKRRISYQSLSETLYVEPHPGIKSGSPSRQQIRRVIKSLERAGLVLIQSSDKHLVLKCLLANSNDSVLINPDTRPTQQTGTGLNPNNSSASTNFRVKALKADRGEMVKADIPHNSDNNFVYLREPFKQFWAAYPQPQNKPSSWEEFKKLNPDMDLFSRMMTALTAQVNHYQQQHEAGCWVPNWKYPANWLAQQSWNDELITDKSTERTHAKHEANNSKKSAFDIFWESCKGGADFDLDDGEPEQPSGKNVISFTNKTREHR